MKPGLAVLPLEVWADVFLSEYKWISRQELAQFANKMKNRQFAEKLQKLLHDCGRHKLHYLQIYSKLFSTRATFAVAHGYEYCESIRFGPAYKDCEFPECEMPENIKTFKELSIRHFDDDVLNFLVKIKPLFTNVFLNLGSFESAKDMRTVLTHILPMLTSVRGIHCFSGCIQFFEQHFPGTLAQAKELHLENGLIANPASIPLDWLSAPLDFVVHGPRFLTMYTYSNVATMVDAVRKHFLEATIPSATFGMFIDICSEHHREDEFQIENATTNEELSVRNASLQMPENYCPNKIHYVEILHHPMGEDATKLREWLRQRAYAHYAKKYSDWEEQVISIGGYPSGYPAVTIGQITKKVGAINQDNDQPEDGEEDAAGPSNKKMKK